MSVPTRWRPRGKFHHLLKDIPMKVLFIISNSETAFWLSEVTHPYWHLVERGVEVDFASPKKRPHYANQPADSRHQTGLLYS
jgi:putative intracellular protease/amidase